MAKKLLLACTALCLLLTGCSPFTFQSTNDLLRAPALGQGQGEIQKALADTLSEEPQYKFPKEGDWRSPLIKADLNGDGSEEGVLLYSVLGATTATADRGSNVYVAVLENRDGAWVVTQDVEGLSTEVASLRVANLLGDGTRQLIVGYGNANLTQKNLALYRYADETLSLEMKFPYSRYELGDFTGRGGTDLVIVSPDDQAGGLKLQYVPTKDGQFEQPHNPVPLSSNFTSCSGIYPSTGADGRRLLVLDGVVSDTGMLASQIVEFSNERFFVVDDSGAVLGQTGRLSTLLKSRDIDGDGVVEIPTRVGKDKIDTPRADKNLEFVEWSDYTGAAPVPKCFGVLDSDRGVFVRLPLDWKDGIKVVDGAARGEWQVQRLETRESLISLQVLDTGEPPPTGAISLPGASDSCLLLSSQLSMAERDAVDVLLLS